MGLGHEFSGPTIAPQNPAVRLLVGEEGFGDVGPTSWPAQTLYFIDVGVFPFAWEMCRIKRHPFSFTHAMSFDVSVLEVRLHEDLQILWLQMVLEIEPKPSCP